jgi:hypothetical protein
VKYYVDETVDTLSVQTTNLAPSGQMQSMSGSMPMEFAYASKKAAVGANFTRAVYQPRSGSSWAAGGVVEIDIPTIKNTYLDTQGSYLTFTVTNTNAAAHVVTPQMGASSFIKQMQLKHAGATLEDIQQYHQVYAFYLQAQTGRERLNTSIGQMEGITCGEVAYNTYRTTGNTALAQNATQTFYHQVFSGLIGPQNHQYVPLSAMNGAGDMTLRLIINDATAAVRATDPTFNAFTITDMKFVAQIVQLDDIAESKVRQEEHCRCTQKDGQRMSTPSLRVLLRQASSFPPRTTPSRRCMLFPLSPHLLLTMPLSLLGAALPQG